MISIEEHMQRQTLALEALTREVLGLRSDFRSRGRVDETVVRAVTNLADGLTDFAKTTERQHEEVMAGLVVVIAPPSPPRPVNGTTGQVPVLVAAETESQGEISGDFKVGDTRVRIDTTKSRALRIAKGLGWLILTAGSGFIGWLVHHLQGR